MNIKITKEDHEFLMNIKVGKSYTIGSHLYGTVTENSDVDMLMFYDEERVDYMLKFTPFFHQFQYDDEVNNIQYIWTSHRIFKLNQLSGDSTINSDVLMFSNIAEWNGNKLNVLGSVKTYKVLKAYLGRAKRDLKEIHKKNKLFHILRGIHTVTCIIINNRIPIKSEIIELFNIANNAEYIDTRKIATDINTLKTIINNQLKNEALPLYPKFLGSTDISQKAFDSLNSKIL